MKTHRTFVDLLIRSVMAVLLGIGLALLLNGKIVASDVYLDEIKTKTDLYEQVTVTGHNDTDIFVVHSKGMANVKIKDLDPETLWRVGLGEKPLEPGSPEAMAAAEAAANQGTMPAALAKLFESASRPKMESDTDGQVEGATAGAGTSEGTAFPGLKGSAALEEAFAGLVSTTPVLIGLFVGVLLVWLFYCFCLKLIVEKTGTRAGLQIWIPILQYFPALRAANMSGWWLGFPLVTVILCIGAGVGLFRAMGPNPLLLVLLIPYGIACLVWFIAQIVWCFKIVQARGKSGWFTAFMVLWLLSPFATPLVTPLGVLSETLFAVYNFATFVLAVFSFLYLAFSSAGSTEDYGSDESKIVIQSAFSEA